MANLENEKCARWLEECVRTLFEEKAEKISVCAILPDGDVFAGYFGCDVRDKAVIANAIQTDAMIDMVLANIDDIRNALGDDENE